MIRSFHKTPDFLLTFILQNFFNSVNKKKLKNSFIEKFHSNLLWVEINKMINVKLLSFSKTYLCRGNKSFSILSEYLFDIYLQDLNLFINSLYTKYNNQVFLLSNIFQPLPIYFSPVKFGKNKNFSNLIEVFSFSYRNIYSSHNFKNSKKIINLKRCINVFMYKHHFCMFFSGSKDFSYFIQEKFFSFVKSNLHFGILECATCIFP